MRTKIDLSIATSTLISHLNPGPGVTHTMISLSVADFIEQFTLPNDSMDDKQRFIQTWIEKVDDAGPIRSMQAQSLCQMFLMQSVFWLTCNEKDPEIEDLTEHDLLIEAVKFISQHTLNYECTVFGNHIFICEHYCPDISIKNHIQHVLSRIIDAIGQKDINHYSITLLCMDGSTKKILHRDGAFQGFELAGMVRK